MGETARNLFINLARLTNFFCPGKHTATTIRLKAHITGFTTLSFHSYSRSVYYSKHNYNYNLYNIHYLPVLNVVVLAVPGSFSF